ncbi:MAG TPA: Rho termination factor N-terminal domain-containing protein [Solirubrobacteraceae bacterium]|jgi:transcription termination factor Rho
MTVLHRDALEASPLADLHAIASELGIDGFRRLRKADLIDRILERDGANGDGDDAEGVAAEIVDEAAEEAEARPRRRRGTRGGRGRSGRDAGDRDDDEGAGERRDEVVEGVVELLGNGSGFVRLDPPEPSDDDVYVSAAQVRRCELVSGDRVSGPVRKPRRSERYPSLVRVDTINGSPAEEVAEGTPYDELPCAFPSVRLELGSDDPTLKAIEWLTPIGRGSRVVITGGPLAGKTETLRRVAAALAGAEELELSLVLVGVRPEEAAEWKAGSIEPAAALTLAASSDAQAQALERAVETAQRIAARGGHAVVLVDTLDNIAPSIARRALAAARAIVDGGSLTVIATASRPLGGETTVIGLDATRTAARNFPALDLGASGTLRPELLVGDAGADAIAAARAEAD